MKTRLACVVATVLLATVSPSVAADVSLAPASATLALAPGESAVIHATLSVNSPPTRPFTTTIEIRQTGGTLPPGWLQTKLEVLNSTTLSLVPQVRIVVPAGAAPRTYTAQLKPFVKSSSVQMTAQQQPLMATLNVVATCSAAPTVTIDAVSPADFKSPNNRFEDVRVSGTIVPPDGCTLLSASYAMEDEYGLHGIPATALTPGAGGAFELTAQVMVSRNGDDKDGRTYRIVVSASDEAGSASATGTVTIAHDQRREK